MNKKVLWAGLGVVALIVLGLVFRPSKPPVVVQQTPSYGALSGPDLPYDHISVNGVTTWTLRRTMATATTTLCSFQNPAGTATSTYYLNGVASGVNVGLATSTLVSLSVQVSTATGTAAYFDIATSSQPFATSSPMLAYGASIPSGTMIDRLFVFGGVATSSDVRLASSWGAADNIIGPGVNVNVKTSTPGLGGYTYGGQCIAVFRSLSAF